MNREQLACAILTEYENRLPPGQQHTLGARVEAMLRTVDALKLAVAVAPPSVETIFPGAVYPRPPTWPQPTPTEGGGRTSPYHSGDDDATRK